MSTYTLSFICMSGYSHVEEYRATHAEAAYAMAVDTFGPIGCVTYTTRKGC